MADAGRCAETISPRQTVNGETKRKRQRRDLERGGGKKMQGQEKAQGNKKNREEKVLT